MLGMKIFGSGSNAMSENSSKVILQPKNLEEL